MKKSILTYLCLIISIFSFSCKESIRNNNNLINSREISFNDEITELKEELIFYTITEDYKISEESIKNDITSFLALQNADETEDFVRAVNLVEENYEITKVKSFKKSLPTKKASRNVQTIDEVNFLMFDIYNEYEMNNIKTINDQAGIAPVTVEPEIIELLLDCKEYYDVTDGKVNVAMGSVLQLWHERREQGIDNPMEASLPDAAALKEASLHCNMEDVVIDEEASTVYIKASSGRRGYSQRMGNGAGMPQCTGRVACQCRRQCPCNGTETGRNPLGGRNSISLWR